MLSRPAQNIIGVSEAGMLVLLAVSPVIVIFLLMTLFRRPADAAGLIGWVFTALVAAAFFGTSLEVILFASLAGIVASFPISLMVAASIFQINVMEEAGALKRIVAMMKTLGRGNRAVQIMLINVGAGTVLAALGATPVSILPPIMLALGYTPFAAIALPAIGYDALCTYALLGVPVVVFADVAGGITGTPMTPAEAGMYFAQYMPYVTTMIALSMLYLAGGFAELKKSWHVALITGLTAGLIAIGMNAAGLPTLTGVVAGAGVVIAMTAWLKLTGKKVIDRSAVTAEDAAAEKSMSIWRAALPWVLLVGFSILTNFRPLGVFDLLFVKFKMPLEIIPGKPELLRMLWHAYTWVFIATVISIPFYQMTGERLRAVMKKTARRVPRPAFAAAIYFAIAYVLNHSGKAAVAAESGAREWTLAGSNMVAVIAQASAELFGRFYAAAAGYLGLLGGFISGSETSSIAMLTKLHFDTVGQIYSEAASGDLLAIALLVSAFSGIGGGLASVISPAKLQNAAAVIDKTGYESKVIKSTAVISLIMVTLTAILTIIFMSRYI